MTTVEKDQLTWAVEGRWCAVCGADHAREARCPGELQATGPEQQGWKINVQTPRGMEAYGVLLAPTGERWLARVLTFPRVLWLVPGGGHTLKFLARSREQAERKALKAYLPEAPPVLAIRALRDSVAAGKALDPLGP